MFDIYDIDCTISIWRQIYVNIYSLHFELFYKCHDLERWLRYNYILYFVRYLCHIMHAVSCIYRSSLFLLKLFVISFCG